MISVKRITLPDSDEKLLEECEVSAFRSSGKGGQHVNKVSTAVRLQHIPSGIVVTCQEERSQYRNKQICIQRLRQKVEKLNYRPPKRIPTKTPRIVKEKRLEAKARRSVRKRLRRRPGIDE